MVQSKKNTLHKSQSYMGSHLWQWKIIFRKLPGFVTLSQPVSARINPGSLTWIPKIMVLLRYICPFSYGYFGYLCQNFRGLSHFKWNLLLREGEGILMNMQRQLAFCAFPRFQHQKNINLTFHFLYIYIYM